MRKIVSAIKVGIVIGVMACIFYLSSQPATASRALSGKVVIQLKSYIESATWLAPSLKEVYLAHPTIWTRKVAHFVIYLVLGLVTYLTLPRAWSVRKRLVAAIMLCFLYAVTDEWHQSFVPGRGPQVRDVFIDTVGSSVGMGMGYIVKK